MSKRIKTKRRHKLSLKESFPVKADRLRYMQQLIEGLDKEIEKDDQA